MKEKRVKNVILGLSTLKMQEKNKEQETKKKASETNKTGREGC